MDGQPLKYQRVLLKLSGEALAGDKGFGIDPPVVDQLTEEVMELHGMPRAEVESAVRAAGGELVRVVDEPLLGTDWRSYRYTVRKP